MLMSMRGMTTNTFAYNGFGARVRKTDSAGTTTYLRVGRRWSRTLATERRVINGNLR
jgi:YD repeat-containing protein